MNKKLATEETYFPFGILFYVFAQNRKVITNTFLS